jgi:hypothetical protein
LGFASWAAFEEPRAACHLTAAPPSRCNQRRGATTCEGIARRSSDPAKRPADPSNTRERTCTKAHKDLHLTSEEFDEVGVEIARVLDHLNVPEREKGEVLAAIVARKDEVVNP